MLAADVLDQRLQEWRAWCLSGRHHRGQCGSLEGNYRSPQRNMWEAPVNSLQMRPIAYRAFEVELIVVTMPDPWRLTSAPTPGRRLTVEPCIQDLKWNIGDVSALFTHHGEAKSRSTPTH